MVNDNLHSKIEEGIQYARANEHLIQSEQETLAKILKYCQAIYTDTQKIRRLMFWRTMLKLIGLIIVIAPIIVAMFYLPPLLKDIYGNYQEILNLGQSGSELLKQLPSLK